MLCKEISKPISTITSSIMKEKMVDGSTESMPMMISDLDMKQDLPFQYRIASVQSLRKNKNWHAIQTDDMNISMVRQMVKSGKVISTKQHFLPGQEQY